MRVGVYADAFNPYYGGRAHFGGGVAGWRWLDLRALASTLVGERAALWTQARVMQVTNCTARISARDNVSGFHDQDVYLKASLSSGSVDLIEYGYYTSKVKTRPLAVPDRKDQPRLVHPGWPVKVKTGAMLDDPDAIFMVSVADRKRRVSDVNVATHRLTDVCEQKIEAAAVIPNDSDLALPIKHARARVPIGTGTPRDQLSRRCARWQSG